MGKSPAKWIKSVLFGKKSTRSHASKGRNSSDTTDKGFNGGRGTPALAVSSPVISEPVLVNAEIIPEVENGTPSSLAEAVKLPTNQDAEKQENAIPRGSNGPAKIGEEQAAIKAQAAFRGFLARRAFRALRGIIRLQALVRGHLVRRQAVATLRSMQAIVKLQALVRGQRVRRSGICIPINSKNGQRTTVNAKLVDNWTEKLTRNAFVSKIISSSPVTMPLQIQYDNEEPNSVYSWLERWTSYCSWKPCLRSKKAIDSKIRTKRGRSIESESGSSNRTVRKNSTGGVECGPTNVVPEPEKSKRYMKKVSSSSIEALQENPQSELEKVKRSLRKVSSLAAEASDRQAIESEKLNHSQKKVSNTPSNVLNQVVDESLEKAKKGIPLALEDDTNSEAASKSVIEEGQVYELLDKHSQVDVSLDKHPSMDLQPLQSIDKEQNLSLINSEVNSKEDIICHDNKKTGKRRASFSAKTEHAENGLQNTPPVPSYMAKTESSKAKLIGQSSPRFSSDSADRNGITRRHSLPSSTNGKLTSHSPRTQKLIQTSGKGSVKTDKSLLSSRDGNDQLVATTNIRTLKDGAGWTTATHGTCDPRFLGTYGICNNSLPWKRSQFKWNGGDEQIEYKELYAGICIVFVCSFLCYLCGRSSAAVIYHSDAVCVVVFFCVFIWLILLCVMYSSTFLCYIVTFSRSVCSLGFVFVMEKTTMRTFSHQVWACFHIDFSAEPLLKLRTLAEQI